MNVKIVVHEADEGGFWAEVPALPGCVSQGETMDELLANMREAIQAWLDTIGQSESAASSSQRQGDSSHSRTLPHLQHQSPAVQACRDRL